MRFILRLGPVAIRWLAEIEDASERGFTDRQVEGPFAAWSHRHTFVPQGPEATWVKDEVTASLSRRIGPRLIGIGMWLGMPILFAYRGWRTRRMLEVDSRQRRAKE